jgi:23S rRNA U2552 (ribose-2'-O)-methylase RlmE/FtsJ
MKLETLNSEMERLMTKRADLYAQLSCVEAYSNQAFELRGKIEKVSTMIGVAHKAIEEKSKVITLEIDGEQTITLADLLEQNNEASEDVQLSDTEINFIKGLEIGQSTTLDNYNRITRIK